MKAWDLVKVTSEASGHYSRVGYVLRQERARGGALAANGIDMPDTSIVVVRLDDTPELPVEIVSFDMSELAPL